MTKINIKGDVVDNMTGKFYSWFDLDSAYPQAVERTLADADDDLVVDIASPGGDVHAASEIYTMLRDYPGSRLCGHRDLSPDLDCNGEIEPEEWIKACPCFDAASILQDSVPPNPAYL